MKIVYKKSKIKKIKKQISHKNKTKITGIIICVDFSDYLLETLSINKSFLDDLYTGEEVSFTGTHKPDEPKEILRIGSSVELFFDGMKYNLIVESIEKDKSFNERAEDLSKSSNWICPAHGYKKL